MSGILGIQRSGKWVILSHFKMQSQKEFIYSYYFYSFFYKKCCIHTIKNRRGVAKIASENFFAFFVYLYRRKKYRLICLCIDGTNDYS